MHPLQLYRWFISNKGKELSPKEKPLDTPAHKSNRLIWVKDWYDVLTDKFANVAMLDEKWFYTTNRRRKIKKLPIRPGEVDGDDITKHPHIKSRLFAVKSMFMGDVGRQRPDKNFDGRIFLERISKTYTIKKRTANPRFSDEFLINSEIKNGKWRQFYVPDMTCDDLKKIVGDAYELEDYIIDRLEFSYKKLIGKKGKKNIFESTMTTNCFMIIILNYLKLV